MGHAATRAIAALVAAGVPHEVLRYRHDPRRPSFGAEAVEKLATGDDGANPAGVAPGQIYKTLVVTLPHGLAVAVLPVPSRLSLKAVAAAFGAARATMADPAVAQRSTGYLVGGISPFGQRNRLPTVLDASALGWDRLVCSVGRRGWDVAVAPDDLIRLTGAITADIQAGGTDRTTGSARSR